MWLTRSSLGCGFAPHSGDGAETAAVNILTRIGGDEVGWRSIDRMVGGKAQPDSARSD